METYGSKEEIQIIKSDDQIDTLEKAESSRAMHPVAVQSGAFEGKKSSPPTFSKGRLDALGKLNQTPLPNDCASQDRAFDREVKADGK